MHKGNHTGHDGIRLSLAQGPDGHDGQQIGRDIQDGGGNQQCPGAGQAVRMTRMHARTTANALLSMQTAFVAIELMALRANQNTRINGSHGSSPETGLPKPGAET